MFERELIAKARAQLRHPATATARIPSVFAELIDAYEVALDANEKLRRDHERDLLALADRQSRDTQRIRDLETDLGLARMLNGAK